MKSYLKTKNGILYHGDCLDVMGYLSKKNIKFDLILTDPPYGTTNLKWDSVIPFDKMWSNLNNVINDNTPICLFGSEPFSSKLRLSNLKYFKYDWIWHKSRPSGIAQSKYQPMKSHEIISNFSKTKSNFYGIKEKRHLLGEDSKRKPWRTRNTGNKYGLHKTDKKYMNTLANPKSVQFFKSLGNYPKGSILHPTQKPINLYKYLIKTYTKENDLILDFCAGSGTLAIACHDLNRKYIMIEKEIKYCEVIKKRMIDNNIKILNNKIKLRKR